MAYFCQHCRVKNNYYKIDHDFTLVKHSKHCERLQYNAFERFNDVFDMATCQDLLLG